MHFLFHCYEYPPVGYGVGAYIRNMAYGLVANGHRATVVCGRAKNLPEKSKENGITVYRFYNRNEIRHPAVAKFVLNLAQSIKVDWIEGADHLGECASLLSQLDRPPIIIKVHNCNALRVVRNSLVLYSWQKPLVWAAIYRNYRQYLYEKRSIRSADILIAPSLRIIKELQTEHVDFSKSVIHIANPIPPESNQFCNKVPNNKNILFAGRLNIGKGVHLLPSIMKRLRGSGATLEIAGADTYARGLGSIRKWLEKRFGGDNDNVRFLGRIEADHMRTVFQRARVVIVPSRWDNFPTVILEAMRYARPVVASIHGGMPEMLKETLSKVCDPENNSFTDAIKEFLFDDEYTNLCGQSMRKKLLNTYTPEKIVKNYVQVISEKLGLAS